MPNPRSGLGREPDPTPIPNQVERTVRNPVAAAVCLSFQSRQAAMEATRRVERVATGRCPTYDDRPTPPGLPRPLYKGRRPT